MITSVRREKVDIKNELLILSYMVMNKEVLYSAYLKYKSKQLKTTHFTKYFRPIFRWLIIYQKKFDNPPKRTISKIFRKAKKNLNKEDTEIIEEYLSQLAEEFQESSTSTDPEYICQEVIPDFIREKELLVKMNSAQIKLDQGMFKEAESVITEYVPVVEDDESENLGTIIPYTKEDLILSNTEDKGHNAVFAFSGDLHRMIGSLERTWLVAITGVEKSGKSYFLQEMAFQAVLYQKKKVLMINLELSDDLVRGRTRRRISLTARNEDSGKIISPIVDCENNQYGICKLRRENQGSLFENKSTVDTIKYKERKDWKVCDKCRFRDIRKNASKTKRFTPTIWFKQTNVRKTTDRRVIRAIERNRLSKLSNLRIKCFPRYSVSFNDVENYIRRYVDKTKWKPDIIIFDYIDILAAEKDDIQTRIDVDIKWKKASKLAGEMNCLVVNADQATKTARTQYSLDQMSTSESKTKDSHLDARIAISQTDEERNLCLARVNVLFHRHSKFSITHEVLVCQRLETSEPLADNTRLFQRGKKYNVSI